MNAPILSAASEKAHEELRALCLSAIKSTARPFSFDRPTGGGARGEISNLGVVFVDCTRELVERARGLKVRNRLRFYLDGSKILEKTLYEKARAL